jgi:TetR/AcrR family transcriptional repressor of lmrAB and yxaGH operons
MALDTRSRMIRAAATSFRTRGLAATSFTEVLAASGAARGAIYHHFPEGKAELARAAVEWFGEEVEESLRALDVPEPQRSPTPADVVERFLEAVRPVVADAAEGCGCPVAAVSLESTRDDDRMLAAADAAFGSWSEEIARQLRGAGLAKDDASDLAALMTSTLEGAQILCRASRTIEPFDRAAAALRRYVCADGRGG